MRHWRQDLECLESTFVPPVCCAGAQWKLYFLCISELKLLLVLFTAAFKGVASENLLRINASDFMIVLSCR
jgi:hypothetical protein